MTRPPILDKTQSCRFSKCFSLTADPEDIFAELRVTLEKQVQQLHAMSEELVFLPALENRLKIRQQAII